MSQRDRAMLRVIEYFAVTQSHSKTFEVTSLTAACVSHYISISSYLVLFLRYTASNNGVTLKSWSEITQSH